MFVNHLSAEQLPTFEPVRISRAVPQEAQEVSFCEEGMCFTSAVSYEIGTVLSLDFSTEVEFASEFTEAEGIVVECVSEDSNMPSYRITVLFT